MKTAHLNRMSLSALRSLRESLEKREDAISQEITKVEAAAEKKVDALERKEAGLEQRIEVLDRIIMKREGTWIPGKPLQFKK